MIDRIEFGKRLKHFLINKEIKQQDFAQRIGKSPQTITNWINGDVPPNPNSILAIIKYYEVDARWLIYGIIKSKNIVEEDNPRYDLSGYYKQMIIDRNAIIEAQKLSLKNQQDLIKMYQDMIVLCLFFLHQIIPE